MESPADPHAVSSPTTHGRRALILATDLSAHGGIQRFVTAFAAAARLSFGDENVRVVTMASLPRGRGGRLAARASFIARAMRAATAFRPEIVITAHVNLAAVGALLAGGRAEHWVIGYGRDVWGRLRPGARRAFRRADRVLTISAFTADVIAKVHGVERSRIEVLPCMVDDRLLDVDPDDSAWTAAGLKGTPSILTVARLESTAQYKGHDEIIRALPAVARAVPDVRYAIVGDGNDRTRLEALAREHGVAARVAFLGAVSDKQLVGCYRSATVFAMPARTILDPRTPRGEGFGIVFLEAMAFGIPVVGPSVGAPTEFIRDGDHGLLVDPSSHEELTSALVKLLTSPDDASRMGARGRTWVAQFSTQKFNERVAAIFGRGR